MPISNVLSSAINFFISLLMFCLFWVYYIAIGGVAREGKVRELLDLAASALAAAQSGTRRLVILMDEGPDDNAPVPTNNETIGTPALGQHQSTYDALTRLPLAGPFRRALQERIDHLQPDNTPLHVIHMDIENFKAFNRAYGLPAGDVLLVQLANAIREVFSHDLATRSGVDMFVVATRRPDVAERVDELRSAAYALAAYAGMDYGKFQETNMRDIPRQVYDHFRDRLPHTWQLRAEHWFTEFDRVERGAEAWRRGDLATFGRLSFESGWSSIYNWETGSPELKTLYDIMTRTDGIYGGRFSGAGFKGCCMALIDPAFEESICQSVAREYLKAFPQLEGKFSIHICQSADGVMA